MTRKVTHIQHQKDYDMGFFDKLDEIKGMGIDASCKKFSLDYPLGHKAMSLASWYYSEGQIDAIYQYKNGYIK